MVQMEDSSAPEFSVVVASFSGETALARCLESLEAHAPSAEVVVALNQSAQVVDRLAARFTQTRFVRCEEGLSVFRLRVRGLNRARGRKIALIEDHCTVGPGWLAAIEKGLAAGHGAVGGPIDNGLVERIYDWSLYLCEYSEYMPPLPEGPAAALLAANVSYNREALWACRATWQEAFYDNEVHDALRAAGYQIHLAAEACVASHLAMTLPQAMSHLFAGGRRFGGYRKSMSSPARRLFWACASPLVPLVWLGRIMRRVAARRPGRLPTLALGLPYAACMLLAWAAGEAVGYLSRVPSTPARGIAADPSSSLAAGG